MAVASARRPDEIVQFIPQLFRAGKPAIQVNFSGQSRQVLEVAQSDGFAAAEPVVDCRETIADVGVVSAQRIPVDFRRPLPVGQKVINGGRLPILGETLAAVFQVRQHCPGVGIAQLVIQPRQQGQLPLQATVAGGGRLAGPRHQRAVTPANIRALNNGSMGRQPACGAAAPLFRYKIAAPPANCCSIINWRSAA